MKSFDLRKLSMASLILAVSFSTLNIAQAGPGNPGGQQPGASGGQQPFRGGQQPDRGGQQPRGGEQQANKGQQPIGGGQQPGTGAQQPNVPGAGVPASQSGPNPSQH